MIETVNAFLMGLGIGAIAAACVYERMRKVNQMLGAAAQAAVADLAAVNNLRERRDHQIRIARTALDAIANQNAGQATFEVWAKKMAADALHYSFN